MKIKASKKAIPIALLALIVAASVLSGCQAVPAPAPVEAAAPAENPQITASGRGEIIVSPDVAYINAGVTTYNVKAQEAAEENNQKMKQLHSALADLGIAESDIKTVNFSLYPQYSYNAPEPTITGYTSSNIVRIAVKDISKVSTVIDAMTKAGATDFQGVTFDLLDNSEAYSQALTKAVENAKAKVETMAGAIGAAEITPVSFVENTSDYYPIYDKVYSSMGAGGGGSSEASVSAGQLNVTASVTVVYEIAQ
jgi:uncharacterized protein YggE